MLAAWAAHGYIVAAPEFPLTDQDIAGSNLDENDIQNQPADVRYVTDWLVSSASPLSSRIDPNRVAVTGHSDGAETALAAGITPTPAGEPAYRAVIAMSVQPLVNDKPTTNPPILITQGDADTINPPSYGYETYSLASAPKYLLVLHGAEHLPPLESGSQWLAGIEAATEAFLDAYLVGGAPSSGIAASIAGNGLFSLSST
jgi:acetyl esterase/lipase